MDLYKPVHLDCVELIKEVTSVHMSQFGDKFPVAYIHTSVRKGLKLDLYARNVVCARVRAPCLAACLAHQFAPLLCLCVSSRLFCVCASVRASFVFVCRALWKMSCCLYVIALSLALSLTQFFLRDGG